MLPTSHTLPTIWAARDLSTDKYVIQLKIPFVIVVTVDQCIGKKSWSDGLVDVSCSTLSCATDKFNAFSLFMACNQKVSISRFLHLMRLFVSQFAPQNDFQSLHCIEQALQLCSVAMYIFHA